MKAEGLGGLRREKEGCEQRFQRTVVRRPIWGVAEDGWPRCGIRGNHSGGLGDPFHRARGIKPSRSAPGLPAPLITSRDTLNTLSCVLYAYLAVS